MELPCFLESDLTQPMMMVFSFLFFLFLFYFFFRIPLFSLTLFNLPWPLPNCMWVYFLSNPSNQSPYIPMCLTYLYVPANFCMISMLAANITKWIKMELKVERRWHIRDLHSGPGSYLLSPKTFKPVVLQTKGHDIHQSALETVRCLNRPVLFIEGKMHLCRKWNS